MKHTLSIFTPSGKTVMVLILANLLLFGGITGIVFYNTHLSNVTSIESIQMPSNPNVIEYKGTYYWIASEGDIEFHDDVNRTLTSVYSIYIRDGDNVNSIPIVTSSVLYNALETNLNTIKVSLQVVSNDFIIFLVNDEAQFDIKDHSGQIDDTISYSNQYLGLVRLDGSHSTTTSYSFYNITNSRYKIENIREYNDDDLLLHLSPVTDYMTDNDTFFDSVATSWSLYQILEDNLLESANEIGSTVLVNRNFTNPIDFEFSGITGFTDLNYLEVLQDQSGNDLGLFKITYLAGTHLKYIDSQETLHFTGYLHPSIDPQSLKIENTNSNNSLVFNYPNYLAYSPRTDQYQYWDIGKTPLWDPDNDFIETKDGRIFVVARQSNYVDVFNNQSLNPTSPSYDPNLVGDWYVDDYLNYFTFDPLNPTVENRVQFDQSISQTTESKVIFPRPINVNSLGRYDNPLPLRLTSNENNNGSSVYLALQTLFTKSGPDFGYSRTTPLSLVVFKFNVENTGTVVSEDYAKIAGPEKEIPVDFNEDQLANNEFSGINVYWIYSFHLDDNGLDQDLLSVFYRGEIKKFGYSQYNNLMIEDVVIREVF